MDDLNIGDRVTVRWTGADRWEVTPSEFVVVAEVLPDGRYVVGHCHPDPKFHKPFHRNELKKGWVS